MKDLTWDDIEKGSKIRIGSGDRAPKIKDLAAFINKNMPLFRAGVVAWSETPYRKVGRLRMDYKTAYGHLLEVYANRTDFPHGIVRPIFSHKTTDPYRRNSEICIWMMENKNVQVIA